MSTRITDTLGRLCILKLGKRCVAPTEPFLFGNNDLHKLFQIKSVDNELASQTNCKSSLAVERFNSEKSILYI